MEQLKCECCGASMPIPCDGERYIKCNYCGATYQRDENSMLHDSKYKLPRIEYKLREPGFIQKIEAEVSIPEDKVRYYTDAQIDYYVRHEMADQIAEHITQYIKIYQGFDIKKFDRTYYGVVKIDTRNIGSW